jgi:hypothetical protein
VASWLDELRVAGAGDDQQNADRRGLTFNAGLAPGACAAACAGPDRGRRACVKTCATGTRAAMSLGARITWLG